MFNVFGLFFFFSLPGHWKATRYFLLLPRLHYYRTLYRYLKCLDSKEFLSWQSIRAKSFVLQASDQQRPHSCDDAPVHGGRSLNSRLKILKIRILHDFIWGLETMTFEGFLITENSEVVKSRTDVAPVLSHSFRVKVFQRTFMYWMVTNMFYYWCCLLPIRQTFPFKYLYTFLLMGKYP